MTDKQIIIDGVDVSGCCHYNKKTGICSNGFRVDEIPYCNCFTCNYKRWKVAEKQFKAKEQECEELKATLKVIADRPCLNINDCNGNCLPHCKWNAHKLAQEALKELE